MQNASPWILIFKKMATLEKKEPHNKDLKLFVKKPL